MNKVRIFKKNPNRALKAINSGESPPKQSKSMNKSLKESVRFKKMSLVHEHRRNLTKD